VKHPLASGEIPQTGDAGDNYSFCNGRFRAFAPEQGIFVCFQRDKKPKSIRATFSD